MLDSVRQRPQKKSSSPNSFVIDLFTESIQVWFYWEKERGKSGLIIVQELKHHGMHKKQTNNKKAFGLLLSIGCDLLQFGMSEL